jgi:hypothetical protein
VALLTELKGTELGSERVRIDRGPVRVFARSITDAAPEYDGDAAPVPPTFPFAWSHTGSVGREGAGGLPIDKLRGPGRMILHGEQEFIYHRWPKVGDVLVSRGHVSDVYEKPKSNGGAMEFYVTDTDWTDAASGEPVVTTKFTLIINVAPPKS